MTSTGRVVQARIALRLRRHLAERTRLDRASPSERTAWQELRVADLRAFAAAHSPLYAARTAGREHAPLEDLPPLTKAELVEQFDDLVTDRSLTLDALRRHVSRPDGGLFGAYRVGMSSGSSGRPLLLAFTEHEWVAMIANAARAQAMSVAPGAAGHGGRPVRSAKIGSPSPWHLSQRVGDTLADPRRPSLRLSAAEPVASLVQRLQEWEPQVLTAYPSVLRSLALEQLAGRLAIAPARVLAGGEPLTPATREAVRAAWGIEVRDRYVTTEAGFVAAECHTGGGLHVLEDHVVVEVLDDAWKPVEPGGTGTRVLVTVLSSRTVPLIRYELADRVTVADGPCPCGREGLRLAGVDGRERVPLALCAADGPATVAVHPVALSAVLDAAPVQGWQVVHDPGWLEVRVAGAPDDYDLRSLGDQVTAALERAGARVQVEVMAVDRVDPGPGGKAARFVPRA